MGSVRANASTGNRASRPTKASLMLLPEATVDSFGQLGEIPTLPASEQPRLTEVREGARLDETLTMKDLPSLPTTTAALSSGKTGAHSGPRTGVSFRDHSPLPETWRVPSSAIHSSSFGGSCPSLPPHRDSGRVLS